MPEQKYRLVTHSDFDGLVCAVLLRELDLIDEIKFVHPKDMQDGKIEITYALFPAANISIHALWGVKQQNTVFATGKSIVNRSSKTNIGELMLGYGGGGHENAGTCQVDNDRADRVLAELVARINADG